MVFRLAMEMAAAAAGAWVAAYVAGDLCLRRAPVPSPALPPASQADHWRRVSRPYRAAGWAAAALALAVQAWRWWAWGRALGWAPLALAVALDAMAVPVVWHLTLGKQLPHLFGGKGKRPGSRAPGRG